MLFLGRSEEQTCFEAVLADLASSGEPDEGHVLLVHGLGGIGKSTLLRRYGQIAADGLSTTWGHRGPRLLLAAVNWESEQRLRAADYVPEGGPPIWVVLDRVYGAIREAAAASRRDAAAVEKKFAPFRAQITKVPELAKEVQRALAGVEREPQTSAADLEAVLQAVGRGAAVLGAAHPLSAVALAPAAIGVAHMASDARDAVRHRRQGPVPDEAYRLILRRVEELVDTFARSLRQVSAHARPVLVLLDSCELISGSQEYLRRAMRASGSGVVWVVGIRLEPEAVGRAFGEAALYRQAISESRLHSVPLSRFTDQTIGAYLERKLPGGLPPGVPLSRVAEVTRGIPLAIALVCDLLNAGQDPEIVLRPVPEPGRPSAVVRELADRYLTHAVHCPPLRHDVPLLYGLALLYSDRLDPDLLAALWNVDPTDVADITTRLAARHDFVLHDDRRLHDNVRDTFRLYLLDDALRAQQRPMNQRAIAHLRDRLTQFGSGHVDDQLTSEDWRSLATALLWHTFWEDNRAGVRLLCHLLPAAHVLAEPFAGALLNTAEFFLPVLSTQQTQVITELLELRPGAVPLSAGPGKTRREPADSRRAQAVLERHHDGDDSVLADDIPRSAYLSLLRVKQARDVRDRPAYFVAALEEADHALPRPEDPPGASSRALAQLAERIADVLIFPNRYKTQDSPEALRAARLAVRHTPLSGRAWWLYGLCMPGQESLEASEVAIRLDPGFAPAHNLRGVSLSALGRTREALAEYDEAIRLRPEFVVAHANRARPLQILGRLKESLAACDGAIRLDPEYAWGHANRGDALRRLGRFEESLAACDEAIRLYPENNRAHNGRGLTLYLLDDVASALAAFDEAIRLDPCNAWGYANRGMALHRLGCFDEALAACDTAIHLEPGNDWAHAHRAGALQNLGRLQDALEAYDQAIRIDPRDAWLHTKRGECLLLQSQHEAATESLLRAAELQPEDALEAQVLLATLTWRTDQVRAAHLATTAREQAGVFLPTFQRAELRAIAHLLAGNPELASAELSSAAATLLPGDIFRPLLYDLLNDPSVPGLDQVLTIWSQIAHVP